MKKFTHLTAAALFTALLLTTSAPLLAADTDAVDSKKTASKKETQKKITDRNHPDYVRCRSESVIGSLAKKRRICLTNREWVEANRQGHRKSREFIEDMQVGSNTNN